MYFLNKLISDSRLELELDLVKLLNKNKTEVISIMGHGYNDYNSSVWMYRIKSGNASNLWSIKYLYVFFENDVVKSFKFSRFRNKSI